MIEVEQENVVLVDVISLKRSMIPFSTIEPTASLYVYNN